MKTLGVLFKIEGRRFGAREAPGSILGAKIEPKAKSETQKIDTKIYANFDVKFQRFLIDFGSRFGTILDLFLLKSCSRFSHRNLMRKKCQEEPKFRPGRRDARGWAKGFEQDLGLDPKRHVPTPAEWAADSIAPRIPPAPSYGEVLSMGCWVEGGWVGEPRGRGAKRTENSAGRAAKRSDQERQRDHLDRLWGFKGLCFEAWGGLGGPFGHPVGPLGWQGDHF